MYAYIYIHTYIYIFFPKSYNRIACRPMSILIRFCSIPLSDIFSVSPRVLERQRRYLLCIFRGIPRYLP